MSETSHNLLAQRLKQLRTAQNMTQAEVATQIGVHKTTIMRWENGDGTSHIKLPVIAALADIFGISPSYLMGWIDEPLSPDEEKLTRALNDARKLYQMVFDNAVSGQKQQSALISSKISAQVAEINQIFLAMPEAQQYIGENEARLALKYLLAYYQQPWQDYGDAQLLLLVNSELLSSFILGTLKLMQQAQLSFSLPGR